MRSTNTQRTAIAGVRRASALIVAAAATALAGCACGDPDDPWAAVVSYNGGAAGSDIFHGVRSERGSWGHNSWGHNSWGHGIWGDHNSQNATAADPASPDCIVKSVAKPAPGQAGATADPNLVEVARLELERDCYKRAEEAARRRLEASPNR